MAVLLICMDFVLILFLLQHAKYNKACLYGFCVTSVILAAFNLDKIIFPKHCLISNIKGQARSFPLCLKKIFRSSLFHEEFKSGIKDFLPLVP